MTPRCDMTKTEKALRAEIERLHAVIKERDVVIHELTRDLAGTSRQLTEYAQRLGYVRY